MMTQRDRSSRLPMCRFRWKGPNHVFLLLFFLSSLAHCWKHQLILIFTLVFCLASVRRRPLNIFTRLSDHCSICWTWLWSSCPALCTDCGVISARTPEHLVLSNASCLCIVFLNFVKGWKENESCFVVFIVFFIHHVLLAFLICCALLILVSLFFCS